MISPERPLPPELATARTKVYWTSESITIVSDQNYEEFGDDPGFYKTEVCHIDIMTGETFNKFFAHSDQSYFSSFYHDDYLYRVLRVGGAPCIQVFQVSTGVSMNTTYLAPIADQRGRSSYRVMNGHTIEMAKIKKAAMWPNYVIAERVSDGIVLRVGSQLLSNATVFVPWSPLTALTVGAAAALTATSALLPPSITDDYYFYLKGSPKTGFAYDETTTSIGQQLTSHRLSLDGGPYRHKYDLYSRDVAYSIHQDKKLKTVRVTRFDASK